MIVPELNLCVDKKKVDIKKIDNYLKSLKYTFQDPLDKKVYFLNDYKESEDYAFKKMKEVQKKLGPKNYPYSSTIVMLFRYPNNISVLVGSGGKKNLEQFIRWLASQYEIYKITDDYNTNWTEKVKKKGINILFKEQKS